MTTPISRHISLAVLVQVFPVGTMVISETETGKYLGRVVNHVLNDRGVALLKIGRDDWSSYADETRYVNIYRAADCLAEENDNGYAAAYTYVSNWNR